MSEDEQQTDLDLSRKRSVSTTEYSQTMSEDEQQTDLSRKRSVSTEYSQTSESGSSVTHAESGMIPIRKMMSQSSEEVISHLSLQSLIEEKLLMALQAVKLAVSSGRLTTEDAQIIKRQMVQRVPFETVILKKLSRAERFCLLDYDQCEDDDEYDDISSTEEESEEKIKEEIQKDLDEAANLRSQLPAVCTPLCIICHEKSDLRPGIFCENGKDQSERHFNCSECLTHWVEVLNGQRQNNSDLLHARHGLVRCCATGCSSPPYQRALTCQNITRPDVLEGYLDNIQYCESLTLYEEYQRKLHDATVEMREAIEREDTDVLSGSDNNDIPEKREVSNSSQSETTSALARLDKVAKRQELESLATTLKSQLPDARMCPHCNYGPVVKHACDDLQSHHGESTVNPISAIGNPFLQTVNPFSMTINPLTVNPFTAATGARIDNSCPQCKWLGDCWNEWLPWDGSLPSALRGNTFRLAGDESSAKLLTPAEARGQRILALQRTSEAAGKALKKPRMDTPKDYKLTRADELEVLNRKRIQAQRIAAKAERERTLRQFKADRR